MSLLYELLLIQYKLLYLELILNVNNFYFSGTCFTTSLYVSSLKKPWFKNPEFVI